MRHDFDPHRDTETSTGESVDDPFDDWPTRSLNDPIGEIQGFQRFARSVTNERTHRGISTTLRVGLAIAVTIFVVVIAAQAFPLL